MSFLNVIVLCTKVAVGFTVICLVYDGKTAVVKISAAAMIIFFIMIYFSLLGVSFKWVN
ncbi:MAG: hypothetical protein JWQ85_3055 [Mucilaginibacter sp.]|nr:hypothetical protein [Mucilaginibacter sp.]